MSIDRNPDAGTRYALGLGVGLGLLGAAFVATLGCTTTRHAETKASDGKHEALGEQEEGDEAEEQGEDEDDAEEHGDDEADEDEDDEGEEAEEAEEARAAVDQDYEHEFGLAGRALASEGRAPFFVLEPGFQLVLADDEGDEQLIVTVLDETKLVDGVTTRVVEERELDGGEVIEVSRNFFAIDPKTKDVFYFGEDVDMYKNGAVASHSGAWRAGVKDAHAGLIVPGAPRVGQRYYQEYAPGDALDRAAVVTLSHTLKTPAGTFTNCLRTEESNGLAPKEREFKTYAPGIGLIQDEDLVLVRYGKAEGR